MPYLGFGYFWSGIQNKYYQVWNQHLRICLIAKFWEETKMCKSWTKNPLFVYFWTGFCKQYCHICKQHRRICLITKFREIKCMNLGPKVLYLGIFGLEFLKNYCYIWNQHPQICQEWVFNTYGEFCYRVRFFCRSESWSLSAL